MAVNEKKEEMQGADNQQVDVAPAEPVKTPMRQQLRNKFKADYPDDDYEADEDGELLGGRIMSRLDEQDKQIGKYKNSDEKLRQLFMDNPTTARFFSRWASGEDPLNLYAEVFGDKLKDVLNGPDAAKNIQAGLDKFFANVKANEEADKNFAENTQQTMDTMRKMLEDGADTEKLDQAWELVMNIAAEAALGKVTEQTLNMVMKSLNYDDAVTNARNDGMAAARNERYAEQLRQRSKGDGQPAAGQGVGQRMNPDRAVERNTGRKSAWAEDEKRSVW